MKIHYYNVVMDDWEGLYINGTLVFEGEFLGHFQAMNILNGLISSNGQVDEIKTEQVILDQSYMYRNFEIRCSNTFPKTQVEFRKKVLKPVNQYPTESGTYTFRDSEIEVHKSEDGCTFNGPNNIKFFVTEFPESDWIL